MKRVVTINEWLNEKANKYDYEVGDIIGNTVDGFEWKVIKLGDYVEVESTVNGKKRKTWHENMYKAQNESVNEGAFVVWYEDKDGKHLLGTFHNKNAADKYLSEEDKEDMLSNGVEKIGTMSKDMWDKKEAPYVKEAKSNVKSVTKKEWDKAHKDYKTEINGQKYMMEYDDSRDATILVPVEVTESYDSLDEAQSVDIMYVLKDIKEFNRSKKSPSDMNSLIASVLKNLGYASTDSNYEKASDHLLASADEDDNIPEDKDLVKELYKILD